MRTHRSPTAPARPRHRGPKTRARTAKKSGAFGPARLNQFAEDLSLDTALFQSCLNRPKYDAVLAADYGVGRGQGVQGTPGFFVNGQYVSGAQPYETFAAIIEGELAAAGQ